MKLIINLLVVSHIPDNPSYEEIRELEDEIKRVLVEYIEPVKHVLIIKTEVE